MRGQFAEAARTATLRLKTLRMRSDVVIFRMVRSNRPLRRQYHYRASQEYRPAVAKVHHPGIGALRAELEAAGTPPGPVPTPCGTGHYIDLPERPGRICSRKEQGRGERSLFATPFPPDGCCSTCAQMSRPARTQTTAPFHPSSTNRRSDHLPKRRDAEVRPGGGNAQSAPTSALVIRRSAVTHTPPSS